MNFSQNFLEKVLLLMLTAGITGFLVPYILKRVDEKKIQEQKEIDNRRLREQKQYEAEIARQSKVIDAQVQLLENLAHLVWEYQFLAIEVSYYHPLEQRDLYCAAVQEYEEKTGEIFAKIRAEISKALRLTSTETYQALKDLFYKDLLPLDQKLYLLMKKQRAAEEQIDGWKDFNDYAVYDLANIVDGVLNDLARELRLKGNQA